MTRTPAHAAPGALPLAVHPWQILCGEVQPAVILDLRQPDRFARGHIEGARNLPYAQVQADAQRVLGDPGATAPQPILLVDPGGARAAEMATWLRNRGYRACFLAGGLAAWTGPLQRSRP